MNFLTNENVIRKNRLIRLVVYFSLLYFAFLWVSGILLYTEKIGFTHASVKAYYLGSEEEYKNPISYLGLLEVTHFHFFGFGMALLLLNHLILFLPMSDFWKLFLVLSSFVSGFLHVGSGWLIRYVSPFFTYLKIVGFFAFNASFLVLLVLSCFAMAGFRTKKHRKAREGEAFHAPDGPEKK